MSFLLNGNRGQSRELKKLIIPAYTADGNRTGLTGEREKTEDDYGEMSVVYVQ